MEALQLISSYAPAGGLSLFAVFAAFAQGLLSFFSPCVLPLIPLYMGYLAGGTGVVRDDGTIEYPRKTVLVNTLFFVLGISFAFFLLGFSFSAVGQFFSGNSRVFSIVAGIVMAALGLYMLGAFGHPGVLETEHRLPFRLDKLAMSPWVALVLGFTFSFAWTPCVGPMLAGVLLMASSASAAESLAGFAMVGVYTLGFVLPFLAVGLFTNQVLQWFRDHRSIMQYTVKAGGILLLVMGVLTIAGLTGGLSAQTNASEQGASAQQSQVQNGEAEGATDAQGDAGTQGDAMSNQGAGQNSSSAQGGNASGESESGYPVAPAADVQLIDQYGNVHKLSDYRGKVVLLNFFTTWCTYCKKEIPDFEALYASEKNQSDVVLLGVANPSTPGNPNAADESVDAVKKFIDDYGITYPVLMDESGTLFRQYGVSSFPTTFAIAPDGTVRTYAPGMIGSSGIQNMINKAQQ